eukprot:4193886-Pleurochrysis_carterae.AAC.1
MFGRCVGRGTVKLDRWVQQANRRRRTIHGTRAHAESRSSKIKTSCLNQLDAKERIGRAAAHDESVGKRALEA